MEGPGIGGPEPWPVLDDPASEPGFVRPEVCPLKILVTVKLVPDTNADKRIDPAKMRLVRTGVETVLNPFDEYALEAALQLKEKLNDGSTVTVVSMTAPANKEIVRKALASNGITTIFNILGPLLNPAQPAHQLVGVSKAWPPRIS